MKKEESKGFAKGIYRSTELKVIQGDITKEVVDAIVNAANQHLQHGGGVAGAISRKGGNKVQKESNEYIKKHGIVPTGKVGLTGPGNLRCKYIIHAVGPVFSGGSHGEDDLLASAVFESFKKAHEMRLKSISITAISSGIFGFPKSRCAKIMVKTAKQFIELFAGTPLKEIRFTNVDAKTCGLMSIELQEFLLDTKREIVLEPYVKGKGKKDKLEADIGGNGGSGFNSMEKHKEMVKVQEISKKREEEEEEKEKEKEEEEEKEKEKVKGEGEGEEKKMEDLRSSIYTGNDMQENTENKKNIEIKIEALSIKDNLTEKNTEEFNDAQGGSSKRVEDHKL